VARKTMAERYAAQRSTKTARRRALPRLSDAVETLDHNAIARDNDSDGLYDVHEVHTTRRATAGATTFTAGATATAAPVTPAPAGARTTMPRRTGMSRGAAVAAPAIGRVNYAYVRRDLQRIAVTAVGLLVLLIVLNVILQAMIR